MLKLRDILKPEAILDSLQSEEKRGILAEFAASAARLLGQAEEAVLDVLLNREKLGSTAVGHGVAIPHGKIAGLDRIVALFGRSKTGVDFQAHDQIPSTLFFVILAPETAVGNYLHALARLSRLMKDEKFRHQLSQCAAKDIYTLLMAEDDKL